MKSKNKNEAKQKDKPFHRINFNKFWNAKIHIGFYQLMKTIIELLYCPSEQSKFSGIKNPGKWLPGFS